MTHRRATRFPPSPSLIIPRRGPGTSGPSGRPATATVMGRYAHSGSPAQRSVSRMVAPEWSRYACGAASEPCRRIDIKPMFSAARHQVGIDAQSPWAYPLHTCPSGWRPRLPAEVTGHASPDVEKQEPADTCIHLDFYHWKTYNPKYKPFKAQKQSHSGVPGNGGIIMRTWMSAILPACLLTSLSRCVMYDSRNQSQKEIKKTAERETPSSRSRNVGGQFQCCAPRRAATPAGHDSG